MTPIVRAPRKARSKSGKKPRKQLLYKIRRSPVHGMGGFAVRDIRKGTRVAEYTGDRISHQEANRRYDGKDSKDAHTFLFTVDRWLVIDGGSNGGDVRFINHSCDPNLEASVTDRRVFLHAVRSIRAGEELSFDYQIGRDKTDPPDIDEVFACRCGSAACRGTMLWPAKRTEARAARKTTSRTSGRTRGRKQAARKGKARAR